MRMIGFTVELGREFSADGFANSGKYLADRLNRERRRIQK